jgi:hypothetical protein
VPTPLRGVAATETVPTPLRGAGAAALPTRKTNRAHPATRGGRYRNRAHAASRGRRGRLADKEDEPCPPRYAGWPLQKPCPRRLAGPARQPCRQGRRTVPTPLRGVAATETVPTRGGVTPPLRSQSRRGGAQVESLAPALKKTGQGVPHCGTPCPVVGGFVLPDQCFRLPSASSVHVDSTPPEESFSLITSVAPIVPVSSLMSVWHCLLRPEVDWPIWS